MKVKIISAKSVAILEQRINKFLSEEKIIVRNIDMTKADKVFTSRLKLKVSWMKTQSRCQ